MKLPGIGTRRPDTAPPLRPPSPEQTVTAAAEADWPSRDPWWAPDSTLAESEGAWLVPQTTRLYHSFLAARALLGFGLAGGALWAASLDGAASPVKAAFACAYAFVALLWWMRRPRGVQSSGEDALLSPREALGTIGLDLAVFSALTLFVRDFGVTSLAVMALPVLMASVLMPRYMAMATAAAGSIVILSGAAIHADRQLQAFSTTITQAGLAGFGLFTVALVASELASRLAREQRSAESHRDRARRQGQLNQLVIEELPEGLLTVDRRGQVLTANPSARKLLAAHGLTPPPPFQLRGVPAWAPLVKAIESAFVQPPRPHEGHEVALIFDDQTRRTLRIRLKFTRSMEAHRGDDVCVVFMEDQRVIQNRIRQDKLAAMGRMSAGIAHEIRNPLSAIAQANALMAEDAQTASLHRLSTMVADNVERLKRIVDDILAVAPGATPVSPVIDLERMLRSVVDDWLHLHPLARRKALLDVDFKGLPPREIGPAAGICFEPEHLRRVLVNLLENAFNHGAGQAGSILMQAQLLSGGLSGDQVQISVFSDGEVIAADTERALFEPFFSTRSRGTGLGLYICRELCERHGASIDYRAHPPTQRHRNEFFILAAVAATDGPRP